MDGWVQIGQRRINLNQAREIDRAEDGTVVVTFPGQDGEVPVKMIFKGDEADGVWRLSRARPIMTMGKVEHLLDELPETPWTVLRDIPMPPALESPHPGTAAAAFPAPLPPPPAETAGGETSVITDNIVVLGTA
ncbi:MAG TPA: hypothetical protein VN541_04240 [Tepidisphaeraceae bacterium]|nr:hypothetical protein [Tepidisphaeraceae bacterium]